MYHVAHLILELILIISAKYGRQGNKIRTEGKTES
jgi:hypothetical protein